MYDNVAVLGGSAAVGLRIPGAETVESVGPVDSGWHWSGPGSPCSYCGRLLSAGPTSSHQSSPWSSYTRRHIWILFHSIQIHPRSVTWYLTSIRLVSQWQYPLRSADGPIACGCTLCGSRKLCNWGRKRQCPTVSLSLKHQWHQVTEDRGTHTYQCKKWKIKKHPCMHYSWEITTRGKAGTL